jgi:hypothetical protein
MSFLTGVSKTKAVDAYRQLGQARSAAQKVSSPTFIGSALNYGAKAFNWIENNPVAANAIGGFALGYLSYRQSERDREEARKARQEDREFKSLYGGASSGETIGSPTLTGGTGLLTDGLLAGEMEKKNANKSK